MKVIIELDNDMLKEIKEGDFEVSRKIVRSFQATIADSIRNGEPIPDGAASKKCHAHWIEGQTDNPNIHNILCSHCFGGYPSKGHANSQYTKKRFKWCPSCGAKMDDERDLQPVTPVHKKEWIPCSVKMPKPDEFVNNVRKYYLAQNEYGDMCVATYTNKGWRPINTLCVLEDIVAWRQLPEQYKAEAEESNRSK